MNSVDRPSLGKFLVRSKPGRMLLFTAFLGLLAFLVPYSCRGRKAAETAAAQDAKSPREGELPPSPQGIGDTITLGQKYDALISRWGGDLSSAKTDLDATRKELDHLRAQIKDERAAQEKEKKDLDGTIQKLKAGLAESVSATPSQTGTPSDPNSPTHPGDPAGAPLSVPLRTIDLGAPAPKEKKETHHLVRIPAAAGGRATLLNGVFAPVTGEPSPVRLRFDAAI